MSTVLLVEKAARPLKVLWADDDPDDLVGERRHLSSRGHSVRVSEDFESTASLLLEEEFDVLILDQRMPKEGRETYDAGSSLVLQLRAGELGELNKGISFVFVTASPDWIDECRVPIRDLSECLGIAEKGDNIVDSLDRWLDEVEPRVAGADIGDSLEDYGQYLGAFHAGEHEGGQEAERRPILTEEWAGTVIDIGEETFLVRLAALEDTLPEHEATLPHEFVSAADRPLVEEGATFTWTMSIEEDAAGERVTLSQVRFEEPPTMTQEEIEAALQEAIEARMRREEAGA